MDEEYVTREILKRLVIWCSKHRYILCMKPKGWTDADESFYRAWAAKYPDPRAPYNIKGSQKGWW